MPKIRMSGTLVTDKARLAELETLWNEKTEDKKRRDEIMKTLYYAFQVPEIDRFYFKGNPKYGGQIFHLIHVSRNAIRIAEKQLIPGTEVIWGQRKHRCVVTGYTDGKDLRLRLLDSPELQQRERTAYPFEVEPTGKTRDINDLRVPTTKELVFAAFQLLGVDNFRSLSLAYTVEDQKLMKAGTWDDTDLSLITNRVKRCLEDINPDVLNEDDQVWWNEIMWFWYHHAISCAVYKKKDKALAQRYADKAREIQGPLGHPNRITELFRLLVHDEIDEARNMVDCLTAEAETARLTLAEYERGEFFR